MTLSLIAAVAENGAIGHAGGLPWRLSTDLRRFRQLTMGHHLIMGRKTFESLGRPLPGRTSIVVTRQANYSAENALVASSLDRALQLAQGDAEVFVIGGAELFRLALPHAERLYLTLVHARPAADTLFPPWNEAAWHVINEEHFAADAKNSAATTFRLLARVSNLTPVMPHDAQQDLLDLNARLLKSIQDGDWKAYAQLCDPTLTAFEAEARGHLVEGLEFHRFYFNLERKARPVTTTMASPHVRFLGENAAVISYVRLVQTVDDAGQPHTRRGEETRVWERRDGAWRHVHFHRSQHD